ncbi:MAG: winged-helix domain-containing protein [Actinomycetota bacterium]|nr:winged-helix domain-containing protein [Actinomycetota bacterium]
MRKAARLKPTPPAVLQRMALYHCMLNDWVLLGRNELVTSKELADVLGVTDATVRSDLSYLNDGPGTPGVGYNIDELRKLLGDFLALPTFAPIAFVGSAKTVTSIFNFFSAERFGFVACAFFSEDPADKGAVINGHEVRPIDAILMVLGDMEIKVAIVATQPNWVQYSVDLLVKAGVKGLLILTPSLDVKAPKDVKVLHFRIPCDLKMLFHHVSLIDEQESPPRLEQVL